MSEASHEAREVTPEMGVKLNTCQMGHGVRIRGELCL